MSKTNFQLRLREGKFNIMLSALKQKVHILKKNICLALLVYQDLN